LGIDILSSASALDNQLRDNRIDAASCCDYTGSVDKDGAIQAKIESVTNEEEAKYDLEQLRFKRKTGCRILQEQSIAYVPE
jgi:hypothetical protein